MDKMHECEKISKRKAFSCARLETRQKNQKSAENNLNRNEEAVTRRCSLKKVLLKISQNSQESICAGVFYLKNLKT